MGAAQGPMQLHQRSCHPCGRSQNWDAVALCATLLPSGVHLPAYETALVPQLCWMASPTQWTWVWASSGRWWREAWQAAVHGVAKSRTQMSDWTTTAIPLDSWYGCLSRPKGLGVTEEKTVSCVHLRTIPSPGRKHTHTQPHAGDSLTGTLISSPSGPLPSQKAPPHCEPTLFLPQSGIFTRTLKSLSMVSSDLLFWVLTVSLSFFFFFFEKTKLLLCFLWFLFEKKSSHLYSHLSFINLFSQVLC